jgi:hypothetical protein
MTISHFLFVAGALRERSSQASAELQLSHGVWGIRTALIRDNLRTYMTAHSCGLVYALKLGICAGFTIISEVLPPEELDELTKDELCVEVRYGFVRVQPSGVWNSTPESSQALLQRVLEITDQAELTRRLNLGMHRLAHGQYEAILQGLA